MLVFFFYATFAAKINKGNNMSEKLDYESHLYAIPSIVNVEYGVFIQDTNGKLWETDDWEVAKWEYSAEPNAVAVIAKETKFLIALSQHPSIALSSFSVTQFEKYMMTISDRTKAKSDYNGMENTTNMLLAQPSSDYAAGWCNAFTFPDGKTKGYLPSLGQLYLAYQNKAAIDAALSACGETAMSTFGYLSSTFWGTVCDYRNFWMLDWGDCSIIIHGVYYGSRVRPFANF